jgi:C4-dicarboxylate transporter DctQ subunit
MKSFFKYLGRLEEGVLGLSLLGLALMAFMEVVGRYLFNHSFTWFEEFSRYFGVFLTFLGASLGVKHGLHFSMDLLITKTPPRVSHTMQAFTNLLAAALFFTVSFLAWKHALKMDRFGVTSAAMGLPMMWAYLPIAVFGTTLSFRFMLKGFRHVLGFVRNESALLKPEPGPEAGEAEEAGGVRDSGEVQESGEVKDAKGVQV